jgi:tRNA pseudouridine13 synthase
MSVFSLSPLPFWTADLPGIGGRIKERPEDFEVDEIPAYEPSGQGEYLYLWVEKRAMGADYFVRQIARLLDLPVAEVGSAGLKDRHAVTRQMISVPARAADRLDRLAGEGLQLLKVSRHGNKLKPGHLHGNRFRVLVRGADPQAQDKLAPLLDRLREQGSPNFYGPQRFGRDGETLVLGLALLGVDPGSSAQRPRPPRSPFLRKLALSAVQSHVFNHYLGCRLTDGLLRRVLPGDVMAKWPFGGLFRAEDVAREQARFDARETVTAGPVFGRKTFAAAADAALREDAALRALAIPPAAFGGFGKLLQGTRRHNLIYVEDLHAEWEPEGVRLRFTLPAGSYATVVLREIMKNPAADASEEVGDRAEGS